jgi:hypothetical protein
VKRLSLQLRDQIRLLRSQGKTYGEIQSSVGQVIPKSTLSYVCSSVLLPQDYRDRIAKLNLKTLNKARVIGTEINRIKREEMFQTFIQVNTPVAKLIHTKEIGKIALAMLCLGEASKYNPKKSRSFSLGNSDPRILCLFLDLLKICFVSFDIKKVRCGVQCRADQDPEELKRYWMEITGIPERLFYKPLIDPRTVGKPTKKLGYKGVLRVYYIDSRVHLELESLANLVYNQLRTS